MKDAGGRVVGVLPDVPALDRVLDYLVPVGWVVEDAVASETEPTPPRGRGDAGSVVRPGSVVRLGSVVRVPLQGRRVRGWVVDLDRRPPVGVVLRPLAKLTGLGPPPELLELGEWAAWRWAGRRLTFLRAASPERAVASIPRRQEVRREAARASSGTAGPGDLAAVAGRALAGRGVTVVRVPPAADVVPLVEAALGHGQALVLAAGRDEVTLLTGRLRRSGWSPARAPDGWAAARGGASVVGARSAAWFPAPNLRAVVVLDEHDPRHQEERAPTWHARDVAVERARRAGVPCLLVSPVPSLDALALGPLVAPSRSVERQGWPNVEVIDRTRDTDPHRQGLYSPRLVAVLRGTGRVGVVVNRTGRARLLACQQCAELVTCERCGSALANPEGSTLHCPRCSFERPMGCEHCGSLRLRLLRPGVARVREELAALLREPVGELTASAVGGDGGTDRSGAGGVLPAERVVVGTEAMLHRIRDVDVIAFPDIDSELAAPRFRAASQVLHQLVLASRRLGGRRPGARLVVQTRMPDHPVIAAALHADPPRAARALADQARRLRLPPFAGLARLAGEGAAELAERLRAAGSELSGPVDGRYLVRAGAWADLADALAEAGRPARPVRIEVDPAGV